MVDYGRYMQPQNQNNNMMRNLMGVMAYRQNKRKNQLSIDLMEKQDKRDTVENKQGDIKYKADMMIKSLTAEEKQPGAGTTIAQLAGIKNFKVDGPQVTFEGPDRETITGSRNNVQKLSQFMIDDNPDAAQEFISNPDNGFIIQPLVPEDPEEMLNQLFMKSVNDGDPTAIDNAMTMLGQLKSVGQDRRTPAMKNAEAMGNKPGTPEYTTALQGLLAKSQGSDKAVKAYVTKDGTIEYLPNNETPPEGWTPYSTGMEITSTPDGGFKLKTGVPGQTKSLGTAAQNKVEGNLYESRELVNNVANSISGFQSKYQTLPFRAKTAWEGIKQKAGLKPDTEMREQLTEFKTWYKTAMRDYGIAVQALGKGNLTKNEEKIYGAGLPNPGKGLWPEDAPEVYWNAIVDRYKGLNATIARHQHYLNEGFSTEQYYNLVRKGTVETAEEMNKIINDRGAELKEEFKGQYGSVQELTDAIGAALQKQFFGEK
jgi:hypothetical protein